MSWSSSPPQIVRSRPDLLIPQDETDGAGTDDGGRISWVSKVSNERATVRYSATNGAYTPELARSFLASVGLKISRETGVRIIAGLS